MKKTAYIGVALLGLGLLGACNGHKDYEQYVAAMKAQPAIIDTLSTVQNYSAYIQRYEAMTDSFASLGIELNPTQTDELSTLAMEITEHATARYHYLMENAPCCKDSANVCCTDTAKTCCPEGAEKQ